VASPTAAGEPGGHPQYPGAQSFGSALARTGFDDLGRRCVSRADAKRLLDAQRQNEIRKQDQAARLEQEAVEKDRQRRAQLPKGLAWHEVPAGLSPAMAMVAGDPDRDRRPKRTSLLEESLSRGTLTMHPIHEPAGGES
jgi:hypothetical protein